jgi:hypothetical protein
MVVACVSKEGGPWVVAATGRFTMTKTRHEKHYRWDFADRRYDKHVIANADGSSTAYGPGLLIGRLVALDREPQPARFPRGPVNAAEGHAEPPARGQQSFEDGEIREYAGAILLWVVGGAKCPAGT